VAILWHEMWHEGLEEASRAYFGDRSLDGMLAILEPLHAMLERGPDTLRELSFHQTFGKDLADAQDWCRRFRRSGNATDMQQAWDLYYLVHRHRDRHARRQTHTHTHTYALWRPSGRDYVLVSLFVSQTLVFEKWLLTCSIPGGGGGGGGGVCVCVCVCGVCVWGGGGGHFKPQIL
jgi:hypothetical protein